MADSADDTGFLARWSRRKALARAGVPEQSLPEAPGPVQKEQQNALPQTAGESAPARAPEPLPDSATEKDADQPVLTLADVAKLTRDSDYTRFMASGVQTEVKNAALKKLFTDPHFNLMDGLDVYIDDYNVADPLPQNMILKMAQAKFLGLVRDAAEETLSDTSKDEPNAVAAPTPAGPDKPAELIASNENTDLQLQPDHESGRAGAPAGPGEDARREH
jgi:hypothetical protein